MVSPVAFKWDVSLGNVISVLTVVVAVAMGWQALNSRVTALETDKVTTVGSIKRLEDERDRITRIEEKLSFIQQSLNRLESRFDDRQQSKTPN